MREKKKQDVEREWEGKLGQPPSCLNPNAIPFKPQGPHPQTVLNNLNTQKYGSICKRGEGAFNVVIPSTQKDGWKAAAEKAKTRLDGGGKYKGENRNLGGKFKLTKEPNNNNVSRSDTREIYQPITLEGNKQKQGERRSYEEMATFDKRYADNIMNCAEVASTVYSGHMKKEFRYMVEPYNEQRMSEHKRQYITSENRRKLVEWLLTLHGYFSEKARPLTQLSLFLSVHLLDRFFSAWGVHSLLSTHIINKYAIACFWIASKIEEVNPPTLIDIIKVSQLSLTIDQMSNAEIEILITLDGLTYSINTYTYFKRFSLLGAFNTHRTIYFELFLKLLLLHDKFLAIRPSLLAAGAFALVCKTTYMANVWPTQLMEATKYTEGEVAECAREIYLHIKALLIEGSLRLPIWAKYEKYLDVLYKCIQDK